MRTAAERANAQRQQYEEAAPQLRAQFTRAQTAAKILKSEEFRTAAARERLSGVIERANALIAAAAGNFVIRIGPDLDFWIDECAFSAEITRGSGYQKFLAGVCCRLALSGFVIIDEGFGVVDPAHLPPLLNMLKSTRAFVLAHTEEIASGIDSPIRITKHTGSIIGAAPEPAAAPVPAFILEMIAPTTTGSTSAYECVCGSSIANTVANISSHNKTAKHRKFMEAQKK
jgi:DNA repair exonuclease SbcCD ATPase subunit